MELHVSAFIEYLQVSIKLWEESTKLKFSVLKLNMIGVFVE